MHFALQPQRAARRGPVPDSFELRVQRRGCKQATCSGGSCDRRLSTQAVESLRCFVVSNIKEVYVSFLLMRNRISLLLICLMLTATASAADLLQKNGASAKT